MIEDSLKQGLKYIAYAGKGFGNRQKPASKCLPTIVLMLNRNQNRPKKVTRIFKISFLGVIQGIFEPFWFIDERYPKIIECH